MELSIFKNRKSKKLAIIIFTIVLFLVVSFLAIYQTQFYDGKIWAYLGTSDDRFHMIRIEGLYHSIQRHQFFPIVNMTFMKGFGYIVNVFYSDFLLYPAAFLRLLGLTSAQTLMVYYVLLNFLTFGVSFLCFYKIQKKYWNSLVFSFVYTLSAYRLHDLAFRHDIGELGAFVFLPIAVLGIYEIFYGDNKKWLYLTAGMTTIIYSHAISPILVAILIVIVACCQIPELKVHPRRLLSLLWATLCSMLLSASYFLPMIEQLLHTHFMLTQSKVALPAGALSMSNAITWSLNGDIGQPNIGIVLLLAALVVLVSTTKIKNKAVKHFSIIGAVMFLCSTKIFPWIIVNYTPLKVIQYPWRLDMLISILLAIFIAADPLGIFKGKFAKGILVCAVFMITVASGYNLVNGNSTQLVSQAKYNQMEPFSIGAGKEYLPTGTNVSELEKTAHKPQSQSGKVKITNFKQYGTRLSFDFKNAKNAKVDLPIIGYYGFQSTQSKGNVSDLKMDNKNNNLAQVTVNGKGKVVVDYFETVTQRISRRISFLALLIIAATLFIKKLNLVDFSKIEGLKKSK